MHNMPPEPNVACEQGTLEGFCADCQFSMPSSLISPLLLHENKDLGSTVNDATLKCHNEFYCGPVNKRFGISCQKVFPHANAIERKANLLWQLTDAENVEDSPVSGNYAFLLTSFVEGDTAPGGIRLHLALKQSHGGNLHAVKASKEVIEKALKWLTRKDHSCESVAEGGETFLKELVEASPTNGPLATLKKFIRDRDWEGRLWGGEKEKFLELVSESNQWTEHDKWMACRNYISYNMAWQTHLLVLPVDGLHRGFTCDTAFSGIPPPQASDELKERIQAFGRDLRCTSSNPPKLGRARHGPGEHGQSHIDTIITINLRVPENVDDSLAIKMTAVSGRLQQGVGEQTDHNMHNTLGSLVRFFPVYLDRCQSRFKQTLFLLQEDGMHGLERVTRGLSERDEFVEVLFNDGLFESRNEANAALDQQLKSKKNQKDNPADSWPTRQSQRFYLLAEWYIEFWIRAFTKALHLVLQAVCEEKRGMVDIDLESSLRACSEMKLEEFRGIWQHESNNSGAKESKNLNVDSDDPPWTPELVALLRGASKHGSDYDPITGDPYRRKWRETKRPKPRGQTKKKWECHSPHMLDFLWLFFCAHLSPECNAAVLSFASGPPDCSRYEQASVGRCSREVSKRSFRCLMLTISAASQASANFWRHSYFKRSRKNENHRASHVGSNYQALLARVSAVRHSCRFFADVGLAPVFTEAEARARDDILRNLRNCPFEGSILARHIESDWLVLYTVAFIDHVNAHEEERRGEMHYQRKKLSKGFDDTKPYVKFLTPIVDASIQLDWEQGSGTLTVDSSKRVGSDHDWLGDKSVGGGGELSALPDQDKSHLKHGLSLVEVLGSDDPKVRPTHRIGQFHESPVPIRDPRTRSGSRNLRKEALDLDLSEAVISGKSDEDLLRHVEGHWRGQGAKGNGAGAAVAAEVTRITQEVQGRRGSRPSDPGPGQAGDDSSTGPSSVPRGDESPKGGAASGQADTSDMAAAVSILNLGGAHAGGNSSNQTGAAAGSEPPAPPSASKTSNRRSQRSKRKRQGEAEADLPQVVFDLEHLVGQEQFVATPEQSSLIRQYDKLHSDQKQLCLLIGMTLLLRRAPGGGTVVGRPEGASAGGTRPVEDSSGARRSDGTHNEIVHGGVRDYDAWNDCLEPLGATGANAQDGTSVENLGKEILAAMELEPLGPLFLEEDNRAPGAPAGGPRPDEDDEASIRRPDEDNESSVVSPQPSVVSPPVGSPSASDARDGNATGGGQFDGELEHFAPS